MNYACTPFQAKVRVKLIRFFWRCLDVPLVPGSVKNLLDDDDDVSLSLSVWMRCVLFVQKFDGCSTLSSVMIATNGSTEYVILVSFLYLKASLSRKDHNYRLLKSPQQNKL